jgi:hypothetical protein
MQTLYRLPAALLSLLAASCATQDEPLLAPPVAAAAAATAGTVPVKEAVAKPAEVRVTRNIASIPIAASSVEAAAAQFDRMRVSTFGSTEARFDASYKLRFFPGWCQITGTAVEATVTGALPQWSGAATADAAAVQRWDTLTAEVRGRVASMERDVRAAAQEMSRLIEAMPAQRDCDAVKAEANRIIEAVKARHLGAR